MAYPPNSQQRIDFQTLSYTSRLSLIASKAPANEQHSAKSLIKTYTHAISMFPVVKAYKYNFNCKGCELKRLHLSF